ncbi:MAG TPA: polysaccharide biosynthesis protein, partial [Desulfomonilaceae bacterium]|nr:polysaccharide biosynthesis protein [Desulfomonilaceae bacterium]
QIIGNAFFVPLREHSRAVFSLYPLILLALMTGARILQQLALEKLERKPLEGRKSKNVLIYGAGRLGLETAQRLQFEGGIHITGFVDDDPKMRNRSLLGIKVMGTGSDLAFLKALHRVEKVFIAFNPQKSKALKRARQRCIDAGLPDILIRSGIPEVPGKLLSSRAYFRGIRFSDVLGMKEVQLDLDKLEPFVEGSVVAVVGAGDQLGEQICRELVRLRAGKLVIIEECQARLSRINEVLHSIGGSRTAYFSYFHPLGFHELTEKVMKSHNVRWVIFNQTNRAMANSDLNLPTLVFANFVNAVRYVEMAKRLKWNFLTFVSPYLKASFSPAERNLHLLAENYVTYAARSADTGFGIVRVSNILENDDETFRNACERISREKPVSFLDEEMKFSSARYSARVVLNCLPLHDRGETFVDGAGLFMDLRALLDFYYEIQGNQKARAFVRSLPLEKDDQKHIASPQSDVCCLPTNSPNILMLSGQKLVEADGHEELIKLNMHYLSPPEKEAIDCFFSFLRNGDGQSAYSTMKSHHENTTVLRNYC